MLTVGISMQLQWGPLISDQCNHREFMIVFISSSVNINCDDIFNPFSLYPEYER